MNKEIRFILLFIFSVFISSISQILLKKSANKTYTNKFKEYLNLRVTIAYMIFFISTLITVYSYKFVPLSLGPILESTGYIFVSVFGVIFLNENIKRKKLLGMILIIFGVILFSI